MARRIHDQSFWNDIRQFFCIHRIMKVVRCHRDVVPKNWQGKQLYIDRHLVHNFVMCDCCKKVFSTNQREELHQQLKES